MKLRDGETWRPFFLPKFKGVPWSWKRGLLLAFAVAPFIDQFFLPLSRWDESNTEGVLFLMLAFRAFGWAEPPLLVVAAGGCLAALMVAISHGIISEVSPVWTPVALVLTLFILLSWRRGRRQVDGSPKSARTDPKSG